MCERTATRPRSSPSVAMGDYERRAVVNPFLSGHRGGWWDAVDRDALADDAVVYVELEDEATAVRSFKIDLVDGLLQTPEYTAAIIRASRPEASEEFVRRQVATRARRQARLHDASPIQMEVIVTEAALRIQVGGHEVMRHQLQHLLRLAELPNVDLRVVPATGAYPAMGTPFYILSFGTGYPDVAYLELLDKGVYLEEPGDVELYATKFAGLRAVALAPDASREFIAAVGSERD
jgi:hypothetical protein